MEGGATAGDVFPEDEAAPRFGTSSARGDTAELPAHDFGLDFPDPKVRQSPLDDFMGMAKSPGGEPQHSAAPSGIRDSLSFLQHESQLHYPPAAGDTLMDKSPVEKEDYGLDDEVIRHKTPSPDLLPGPAKGHPPPLDPLVDFGFASPKKGDPSPQPDSLEDFLSKTGVRPAPGPDREPSPDPFRDPFSIADLSPALVRAPTPPEPLREPSPVREPTPEPPPPKPKAAAPAPSFLESDILEKKPQKKEPEPKPVISKPTSPPPAPPKQLSSGESKSCDGLAVWFNPQRMHPKVEALVYWRDPKKSGAVFGGVMVVLLSLVFYSFISVVAYVSLLVLAVAIAFRVYKTVQQAIQKTSDGHPFKEILEMDLALPADKVRQTSDLAVAHINAIVSELRRLFLVEDLVDSIKFGLGLWVLTYVGSWFNGMTLIILGVVALFTLPKVYETNKAQIDQNLELVASKINEITSKVKAAIPIGKKAEEKKDQ